MNILTDEEILALREYFSNGTATKFSDQPRMGSGSMLEIKANGELVLTRFKTTPDNEWVRTGRDRGVARIPEWGGNQNFFSKIDIKVCKNFAPLGAKKFFNSLFAPQAKN